MSNAIVKSDWKTVSETIRQKFIFAFSSFGGLGKSFGFALFIAPEVACRVEALMIITVAFFRVPLQLPANVPLMPAQFGNLFFSRSPESEIEPID